MLKRFFRWTFMWDYEKEVDWLNEMSAQGWQLVQPGLITFKFQKGEPNKYRYALEFLDHNRSQAADYFAFLEETGIDIIGQTFRWVYYRKLNDGKPFEIFSDPGSQAAHLARMLTVILIILMIQVYNLITNWSRYFETGNAVNLTLGILFALLTFIAGYGALKTAGRIWSLRKNA